MKKQSILLYIVFSLSFTIAFAQTKLIAHKSHSGKTSTFNVSLNYILFDAKKSNFGLDPRLTNFRNVRFDTISFVNDSVSVLISSNYCVGKSSNSKNPCSIEIDTFYNHYLFNKTNPIDSIKYKLKNNFYYKRSIDSIVFIDHSDIIPEEKEKETKNSIPLIGNIPKPPTNLKLKGFLLILFLAIVFGAISFMLNKNKLRITKF